MAMKQAVAPQGEARNDFDIFRGLAQRVGIDDAFAMGRDEMDWLRTLYETARQKVGDAGGEIPDFDTFWERGFVETMEPKTFYNVYQEIRGAPTDNALPTPSGKFEIYCDKIASFGYDDCPGHPVWIEPAEWLGSDQAERYPLHLISNQPVTKLHSQLDFAGISREAKVDGREIATLSAGDATARGIEAGDLVRLFNDRGSCLAVAAISDDVRSGVILLPTGAWFDPVDPKMDTANDKHGNPNVLTLDKGTSKLGQGPIAHTTLVNVEKFDGTPPPVTAFALPEIVPQSSSS